MKQFSKYKTRPAQKHDGKDVVGKGGCEGGKGHDVGLNTKVTGIITSP
jgi:hypothetical protein